MEITITVVGVIVTIGVALLLKFRVGAIVFGIAFGLLGLVLVLYLLTHTQLDNPVVAVIYVLGGLFPIGFAWYVIHAAIKAPVWPPPFRPKMSRAESIRFILIFIAAVIAIGYLCRLLSR